MKILFKIETPQDVEKAIVHLRSHHHLWTTVGPVMRLNSDNTVSLITQKRKECICGWVEIYE